MICGIIVVVDFRVWPYCLARPQVLRVCSLSGYLRGCLSWFSVRTEFSVFPGRRTIVVCGSRCGRVLGEEGERSEGMNYEL